MSFNKDGQYVGYIYVITNNVNSKCYIGQTQVNIEHRWRQHKHSARYPELWSGILYKAMRKYGIENFHIKAISSFAFDDIGELKKELNIQERYYIQKYNSLMPNGYNMTKGGEDVSIRKMKPCVSYNANGILQKRYNSIIEAYYDVKGSNISENGSTLITQCCKGELSHAYGFIWRYEGDDFNLYQTNCTQDILDRYHCEIPIKKYDLQGNLLNYYQSFKDACVDIGIDKYSSSPLCECCKGKRKTAYGFVWRYLYDDFALYNSLSDVYTKVKQYSLDGEYIKTFLKMSDIRQDLNISSTSNISECCVGHKYSAYGYVWRYEFDSFDTYKLPSDKEKCGRKYRLINQYSKDYKYIKTFNTSIEASESVGCKQTSITTACGRKGGGCNGFKWFYADDPNQPDKTKIIA